MSATTSDPDFQQTLSNWLNGSSDRIINTMTNPAVDTLLGLTQGFAQAAMPTRMPTPIGAVLGMGAGGALQGFQTGQGLKAAAIKNQQAQMALDFYKNLYGSQTPGQGGSAPLGMPNVGQSGPNMNGMYMPGMSPMELKQRADFDTAIGANSTADQLLKMIENMGGQGYAPSAGGSYFRVPGGNQALPNIAATEFTKASATKAGENSQGLPAPYDTLVPDSNNVQPGAPGYQPTYQKRYLTPPQAIGQANGQPTSASMTDPFPDIARKIQTVFENPGGNPSATNPRSSAAGNGQFLNATWLNAIRAARPDLAAGKSDPDLLALRENPDVSQTVTEQYARMNGAALSKAGLPVTPATVALAHFLGPQGASTVLTSDPGASLTSVLPAPVIDANPSLRKMTVGGLVGKYQMQMGGTPTPPVSSLIPAAAGIGGPIETKLTPEQQSALDVQTAEQKKAAETAQTIQQDRYGNLVKIDPRTNMAVNYGRGSEVKATWNPATRQFEYNDVGGQGVGAQPPGVPMKVGSGPGATTAQIEKPNPQELENMQEQGKAPGKLMQDDMKDLQEATEQGTALQSNMARLYEMRNKIAQLPQMGAGGQFRSGLANIVETYIKPAPGLGNAASDFLHKVGNLPDAAAAQEFAKLALQVAGGQENSTVGKKGGLGLTKMFLEANPGMDTQPTAGRDMANFLLTQNQMELDYLRGLHNHVIGQTMNFMSNDPNNPGAGKYIPGAKYDTEWLNQENAKTYIAATNAMNGKPPSQWAGLVGGFNKNGEPNNPALMKATLDVVRRVDPNSRIIWSDGKPHVFAQPQGTP